MRAISTLAACAAILMPWGTALAQGNDSVPTDRSGGVESETGGEWYEDSESGSEALQNTGGEWYEDSESSSERDDPSSSDYPPAVFSQPAISLQELREINIQGRTREAQLQDVNDRLQTISALIAAGDRGDILVQTYRDTDHGDLVVLTGSEAIQDMSRLGYRPGSPEMASRLNEARTRSAQFVASLRAYREQLWGYRSELLRLLDADRRRVMADVGAATNINGPWFGNYNNLILNVVQSGNSFTIDIPQIRVRSSGTVQGDAIQVSSTGSIVVSVRGTITFDGNGRATQIDWSNGDTWVRR